MAIKRDMVHATIRVRNIARTDLESIVSMLEEASDRVFSDWFTLDRVIDASPIIEPPAVSPGVRLIPPRHKPKPKGFIYASTPVIHTDATPYRNRSTGKRVSAQSVGRQNGLGMWVFDPRPQFIVKRAHTANNELVTVREQLAGVDDIAKRLRIVTKYHNSLNKDMPGPSQHARKVLRRYVIWLKSLDA